MEKIRKFIVDFICALSIVFIIWLMLSVFDVWANQFDYETVNRYADWNLFVIVLDKFN